MKSATYHCPVYHVRVDFLWDCSLRQMLGYLKRYHSGAEAGEWGESAGRMIELSSGCFVMALHQPWESGSDDLGLLSHETFHLTMAVMNRVGMRFSGKSEEAYAYFHGAMMKWCIEQITRKGKK